MLITEEFIRENRDKTDKFNSVITALYYDLSNSEVYDHIDIELKKVNTIKDNFKKKYLNDRCYSLREHVKKNNSPDTIVNSVFMCINDDINEIKLDKKTVDYIKKYNVQNRCFYWGKGFDTDFLMDVFVNKDFFDTIEFDNDTFCHKKVTRFKTHTEKIDTSDNLKDYMKNQKGVFLYHGKSSILKTMKDDRMVFNKKLSIDDILKEFELDKMIKNHKLLKDILDNINNPKVNGKIKTGKDLIRALRDRMVKTLFYNRSKKDKLFSTFDKDTLNIDLIEIDRIEKGDVSDSLLKDYGGFIAESYY